MEISYSSCWGELELKIRGGRKPPLPFRRLSRRSGRIPAEPYPPLKCLYCSLLPQQLFWPESGKFRAVGGRAPISKVVLPPTTTPTYPQILLLSRNLNRYSTGRNQLLGSIVSIQMWSIVQRDYPFYIANANGSKRKLRPTSTRSV